MGEIPFFHHTECFFQALNVKQAIEVIWASQVPLISDNWDLIDQ